MVNVYDVDASSLIDATKEELKKNEKMKPPEWMLFAKSGTHKERPPQQEDFWYIRGAALLRKVYTKGPVGVSRLRTEYGGRKHRGSKMEEHRKSSGSILRELLQQLEQAGYVKKCKYGREITPQGNKFLDNIAYSIFKQGGVKKPEPEKAPKVEKPPAKPAAEKPAKEKPAEKPEKAQKEEKKEAPKAEKTSK